MSRASNADAHKVMKAGLIDKEPANLEPTSRVDAIKADEIAIPSVSANSFNVEDSSSEDKRVNIKETPKTYWDTFFGVIMMLIGVVLFALSTVFCKLAYMQNEYLTGFDYLIVRSTTLVIASLIQAGYLKVNILDIKKEGRFWLFLRCFLGAIFFPCFYVSLKFLPSSKATLISTAHPVLVTIAAYLFLKENINRFDIIGVVGAFIGVLVMNINKTDSSKIDTSNDLVILGIILCAFTTFLGTGVTLSIRLMNKHLHYLMNPSYFAFTLFAMSIVLLMVYPSIYNFEHYTTTSMTWFVLSGIVHYTAQTVTSVAYKYEEASKIAPFSYTIGIFLCISDIFVFGYKFSFTDILGVFMVIGALMTPILYKVHIMNSNKQK